MVQERSPEFTADILAVDDTPANLQLLVRVLKERGYKVRPAPNGKLALQAARSAPPDLILLDINMPGLNGYEVCEQLKADPQTRDVPVIFLSALNETLDKVRAFAAGGVDYVAKPFQFQEVEARVNTHLRLRRLQKDLEARNAELLQLQELRDNLTNMIVHDLRSPLTAIMGAFDFVEMESAKLSAGVRKLMGVSRKSLNHMIGMISAMLDVGKMEAGELQIERTECDIVALAREAVSVLGGLHEKRTVSVEASADRLNVAIDRDLVFRVLQNLLGNAMKFTGNNGEVKVRAENGGGAVRVSVIDDGPGVPPEYHERIFEKFGQVKCGRPRVGTGLGLAFCRLAVEAHGGRIGVTSEPPKGSAFWFELPKPV